MKRSYIEMYVDTLNALAHHGPLTAVLIESITKINFSVLQRYLDYFLMQGLIKEVPSGKNAIDVVFKLTRTGNTILNLFLNRTQIYPITELESLITLPLEV